jgi:hypothetical protein
MVALDHEIGNDSADVGRRGAIPLSGGATSGVQRNDGTGRPSLRGPRALWGAAMFFSPERTLVAGTSTAESYSRHQHYTKARGDLRSTARPDHSGSYPECLK